MVWYTARVPLEITALGLELAEHLPSPGQPAPSFCSIDQRVYDGGPGRNIIEVTKVNHSSSLQKSLSVQWGCCPWQFGTLSHPPLHVAGPGGGTAPAQGQHAAREVCCCLGSCHRHRCLSAPTNTCSEKKIALQNQQVFFLTF